VTESSGPAPEGPDDLTEHVLDSRIIHRGHYLTFRVDTIERPDGTRAERDVVGHPGAVGIVAIDETDRVLMVRQFRVPARQALLEIPAGTLDIDPETGATEDHALAARRELEEETGYRAASWRHLTSFWTAPGFATEFMHLWLATDLSAANEDRLRPDEGERLQLERIPWPEALAAADRGEIVDAKSLVGLLWVDRLTDPEAPPGRADPAVAPSSVRVSFTPQLPELIQAGMVAARRSRAAQVIGLLSLAGGIALLAIGAGPTSLINIVLGVVILTGAIQVPIALFWYRVRRDLIATPIEMAASADGIDYRTALATSHLKWPTFKRLRETGRFFFLETGIQVFYIPKRAFDPAQLSAFRKLVADAGFGPDGRRSP
jgi:ADP-ribose pyrophosphatase